MRNYLRRRLMALGIIVLILSVVLFMVLMTLVLPKHVLKVVYTVNNAVDRGVKRCLFKGKRCIVYDSSRENKAVIKQYSILQEDGYKTLRCKLNQNVEYLDCDVVLFNRYNKVFKVINIKEDIVSMAMTRATRLPDETSYVRILIRRVNKTKVKRKPPVKVTGFSIFLFSLIAIALTAVEIFAVRACCSYCFGEIYRESFIASGEGLIVIAVLAAVTGVVGAITAALSAFKRARR